MKFFYLNLRQIVNKLYFSTMVIVIVVRCHSDLKCFIKFIGISRRFYHLITNIIFERLFLYVGRKLPNFPQYSYYY